MQMHRYIYIKANNRVGVENGSHDHDGVGLSQRQLAPPAGSRDTLAGPTTIQPLRPAGGVFPMEV